MPPRKSRNSQSNYEPTSQSSKPNSKPNSKRQLSESLSPLSSPEHQVTISPPRRSVSIKEEERMETDLIQAMLTVPEVEPELPPFPIALFPSKFSSLRIYLERSLSLAVKGMRKRRIDSSDVLMDAPMKEGEMEAIIKKIELDCQGLLEPLELQGSEVEEEAWSKECRRSTIQSALEDVLFAVTLEQTENIIVSHEDSKPFTIIYDVLDLILTFTERDWVDAVVPLTFLTSLFEMQTISACFHIFAYLESRVVRLAKDMQVGKGKSLILLRCLNELLRRLPRSKTEYVIFCGRILLFLSSVFPIGEKSGVNLRGGFNLGKITAYEEMDINLAGEEGMDLDSKGENQADTEFYTTFWSLQRYFTNPQSLFISTTPTVPKPSPLRPSSVASTPMSAQVSASPGLASSSGLETVRTSLLKILEVFATNTKKENELAGSSSSTKKFESNNSMDFYFFPKFLTSSKLLTLELSDSSFRRQILIQSLILFQYILAHIPGGKLENIAPGQKISLDDSIWMEALRVKIISELESMHPAGRSFQKTIEQILKREHNWINWKLKACPSIEKPPMAPEVSTLAATKLTSLIKPPKDWPYDLGNPTLTRLWTKNLKSLNGFQVAKSEENFDDLARNWKMTNRIINQKNGQVNSARAIPKTPQLEEKIAELLNELESLNKKSKVLNWRAIRIASTTHLHLFDLIKSGDLNLLISAIDSERRAQLDLEEALDRGDAIPEVEEESLLANEERAEKQKEKEKLEMDEVVIVEMAVEVISPIKRLREEDSEMETVEMKKLKEI